MSVEPDVLRMPNRAQTGKLFSSLGLVFIYSFSFSRLFFCIFLALVSILCVCVIYIYRERDPAIFMIFSSSLSCSHRPSSVIYRISIFITFSFVIYR